MVGGGGVQEARLESARATSFPGASRELQVKEGDWLQDKRCASRLVRSLHRIFNLIVFIGRRNPLAWPSNFSLHHPSISPSNHRPAMPSFFTQHRQPFPTETLAQPDQLPLFALAACRVNASSRNSKPVMIQIAPAFCTPPEYDRCDGCDRVESGEKSL